MTCRPRRLFQEIGQRIGVNWFRVPRSHMILVSVPSEDRTPEHVARDLHGDIMVRTPESAFIRRQ